MAKSTAGLDLERLSLDTKPRRLGIYSIVILLAVATVSSPLSQVGAVSGTDSLGIILVDFSDVVHQKPRQYFADEIIPLMTSYYNEVSYGLYQIKGSALGWFRLVRPLSDFNVTVRGAPDRFTLLTYTIKSVDPFVDFTLYDRIVLVYTGGVYAFKTDIRNYMFPGSKGYLTDDGTYVAQVMVVDEGDQSWVYIHEFGHMLGLPDLYDYDRTRRAKFVGDWDMMGSADYPVRFSAWSKIKLGWIPPLQILQIDLENRPSFSPVSLVALETKASGIHAIQIHLPRFPEYYLVELRLPIGYDGNLPDSGVLVTYIDESKGSGQGIVTVRPNEKGDTYDLSATAENVFMDYRHAFSIIVLSKGPESWVIRVSGIEDGNAARGTAALLFAAAGAIEQAKAEVRTEGLAEAEQALASGWNAYSAGNFALAETFAAKTMTGADNARHPAAYIAAENTIEDVKAKLADARRAGFKAPLARIFLLEADQEIRAAEQSLRDGKFDDAVFAARTAEELIAQSFQIEYEFTNPDQEKPPPPPPDVGTNTQEFLPVMAVALLSAMILGIVVMNVRRKASVSVKSS